MSSVSPSNETPGGASKARRILLSLLGVVSVVASGAVAATPVAASTRAATSTNGYAYTGINPCRVEDTRTDGQTLGAGGTLNVTVAGGSVCTAVPSSATAVVLNVTTTDTTASSYFTVWPTGQTQPLASNQNWGPGATIAARVTAGVGTSGQVSIFNFAGNADIVVDIDGYYSADTATGAGHFTPVSPFRVADTRNTFQTLAPNSAVNFQIAGAGIPSSGVQAAVLNVTVTNTQASGFLTISPTGSTAATTSMLNWGTGQTIPNRTTAELGTNGQITVYNGSAGSTDVVIDVDGWYATSSAPNSTGSLFTPLAAPVRIQDTRNSGTTMATNSTSTLQVAGANGIPSNAVAVDQNVTVTNTTGSSYLTVYPNSRPLASDNNWLPGWTIANSATSALSTGGAENFYNLNGSVDVVVDADGYFLPAPGIFVTANPASLPAEGGTTLANDYSVISVTVTDAAGHPVSGDNVQFTQSGTCGNGGFQTNTGVTPLASGGTSPFVSATGSNGQASVYWVEGSTTTSPGTCTITATEANGGKTGTVNIALTAVANKVYVTPTSSNVNANGGGTGGTTQVTITVCGFGGTGTTLSPCSTTTPGITGDNVTATLSGNPSGACGTLSPTSGTTSTGSTGGTLTANYASSSTPGFCTITATEAATGGSGSATIDQTVTNPTAVNTVGVTCNWNGAASSSTNQTPANGTNTLTCTANVSNASGPVAGDPIAWSVGSASPSGACGTVSPTTGTTDASGNASTTYTVSTTGGTCTVTAKEAFTGGSGSAVVYQSAVPNNITLTANPSTLPADGTSKSTLTATVANGVTGTAVGSDVVTFSYSGDCGSPTSGSAPTTTTGSNGQAQQTYTAAATPGFCQVTATDSSGGSSGPVNITQTLGSTAPTTTVSCANASGATACSIPADGTSTLFVNATVKTSNGAAVQNDNVLFSTSGGSSCGTFTTANPASTGTTGTAQVTYKASTTAGSCTITATESQFGTSGSTTMTQTAVPNTISVAHSKNPMPVGGSDTLTITVCGVNGTGATTGCPTGQKQVVGDSVTLATGNPQPSTACGSVSPTSGTTNSAGQLTATYTANTTTPGFCTVTITEAGTGSTSNQVETQTISGATGYNTAVTCTYNGAASSSTNTTPANGTTTVSCTATVTNASGPVNNDVVHWFVSAGAANPASTCGSVNPSYSTTNASGVATTTYTVSSAAGQCTVNAQEANGGSAGSAQVYQSQVPNNISASANPTAVSVSGNAGPTTSTITATVTSGVNSAPVQGDSVTFVMDTTNNPANCGSVTSPSTTNASGQATSTYTTGTATGVFCGVIITETQTGSHTEIYINQQA